MPKKRKRHRRPFRGHHPAASGARAGDHGAHAPIPPPAPGAPEEPELISDVRELLADDHPLGLLGLVSSIIASTEPHHELLADDDDAPPAVDLATLLTSFSEVELVETSALLAVLAELVPDELTAHRLRREVARREHPLPDWLAHLTPLRITGAMETADVLGDGDNTMVAARTASGHDLTAVVYIDHNLGTVVKDAFVVPAALDDVAADLREASGAALDLRLGELDLPEARARISDAAFVWSRMYPPLETDTWPACRPLVEWLVRHLPEGGTGYVRPEWSEEDRAALAERFFASPHGRGHDDDRDLFDTLLWFGCDYGPGDPLRWSPVAVEIFLTDWLPRKVLAEVGFLEPAPDLLRSMIRFSHAERGIPPHLTEETLAAVDRWEPAFREIIRSPRPQGAAALLAALGVLDDEDAAGMDIDDWLDGLPDHRQLMREILAQAVGGPEALRTLDATPLPDEPFDWEGVPDDVREPVAEVLALVDGACDELLDVECRTAARRLLAAVVAGDPGVFRRRGRTDTAAAAIVWVIAKANNRLSYGGLTAKELLAWFGLTGSVSQRASTLCRAAGIGEVSSYHMALGSPRYLTSDRRAGIITTRDYYEDD